MIDITGLDKAEVLHALVSAGSPMGAGVLQAREFTLDEAREWCEQGKSHDSFSPSADTMLYFDYVTGVPIKCDLSGDEFDPWGYDRDHGQGAASRVVEALRARVQS